jgi:hypothetical protein
LCSDVTSVLTDMRDELGERAAAALRADGHDVRYMQLALDRSRRACQQRYFVAQSHFVPPFHRRLRG